MVRDNSLNIVPAVQSLPINSRLFFSPVFCGPSVNFSSRSSPSPFFGWANINEGGYRPWALVLRSAADAHFQVRGSSHFAKVKRNSWLLRNASVCAVWVCPVALPPLICAGVLWSGQRLKHLIWRLETQPSWEPFFSRMRTSLAVPPCLSQEGFLCSRYLNESDNCWLWATLSSRASGCSLLGLGECCQFRTTISSMGNTPQTRGSIRASKIKAY